MALAIEAVMPLAPPSRVGAWVESLAGEALTERMEQIADIEGGTTATEKGDATPSSILSARPDASQSDARREARRKSLPPGERTGPTRPDDTRLNALTRIENGARLRQPAMEAAQASTADDSLAAVAGVPQGASRRILLLATALVIGLVVFGAFRLRARPAQSALPPPSVTVEAHPVTTRTGSIAPTTPPTSSEPPTFSVQSLPAAPLADDSPPTGTQPASKAARSQKAPMSQPPVQSRPRVSPATPEETPPPETAAPSSPSPAATAPSCDPPYWYDADGNKRYYRHCVGH
jgi:hypothetical protein